MKLGDSRTLEGPGVIPAQDHRDDVDTDARAALVCVRIVDRAPVDRGALHIEDEELHGDRQGVSVWRPDGDRRPCAAWREVWPCVVLRRGGDVAETGGGYLPDLVTTPSGNFPSAATTPSGGSSSAPGDIPAGPSTRNYGAWGVGPNLFGG